MLIEAARFALKFSIELIVRQIISENRSAMLLQTGAVSSDFKYPVFNKKMKLKICRGLKRKINPCSY
jgi:hypothetical protein